MILGKYWDDLKVAEQLNSRGDAMHQKLSEIYMNEYFDISCSDNEQGRYMPGAALDAAFPHST